MMRYVIDTNIFLWYFLDDPQLPDNFRSIIERPTEKILLSIASLWEIAIKSAKGHLDIVGDLRNFFQHQIIEVNFEILPIKVPHLLTLRGLPFHHKDPFDRLIIAQSISEKSTLLYSDKMFVPYFAE